MNVETIVWITTSFEGFHRWTEAPEEVAFLRDFHRHTFHVRVGIEVAHSDREVEFFQFKKQIKEHISIMFEGKKFSASCEMIAHNIFTKFSAAFVEVSEDGENGATVMER